MKCRSFLLPLVLPVAFFMLAGCASKVQQAKEEAYQARKPIQVRTSRNDERPDWVTRTSYEQDGSVYFVGAYMEGADYPVSVRCANAEAMKVAVQSISQFLRVEFTQMAHGSNSPAGDVERYVQDGIAQVVKGIHIQGVKQEKVYYEEQFDPATQETIYNVFVRLRMSKPEYMEAKADAVRQLRERFSEQDHPEAKEKAEKLLNQLRDDIGSGV